MYTIYITKEAEERLKAGKRVTGTIRPLSPLTLVLNDWKEQDKPKGKYRKVAHGRITITDESVRFTARYRKDEQDLDIATALISEAITARDFVTNNVPRKEEV